jgi:hypothetical protein
MTQKFNAVRATMSQQMEQNRQQSSKCFETCKDKIPANAQTCFSSQPIPPEPPTTAQMECMAKETCTAANQQAVNSWISGRRKRQPGPPPFTRDITELNAFDTCMRDCKGMSGSNGASGSNAQGPRDDSHRQDAQDCATQNKCVLGDQQTMMQAKGKCFPPQSNGSSQGTGGSRQDGPKERCECLKRTLKPDLSCDMPSPPSQRGGGGPRPVPRQTRSLNFFDESFDFGF